MKPIDVLIVENDGKVAQGYAELIQQKKRLHVVAVLPTISAAWSAIREHKPGLVLLGDSCQDGNGIELLKYLSVETAKLKTRVIYMSDSCDMETAAHALMLGCFDYLLKPVATGRLEDSLNRYLRFSSMMHAYDTVNQTHIDMLFNLQSKYESEIEYPKGINEMTLNKVKEAFYSASNVGYTAESLSEQVGISKSTARRYLDYCSTKGFLYAENSHGKVGRPQCTYLRTNI